MNLNDRPADLQHREGLISLMALTFIAEHALLRPDQLEDAKKSLQALFLHASGEETMLRKLIDILKITKQIHQSFASISTVLSGISRGVQTVHEKIAVYKQVLATVTLSAEENTAFAGPFLSFSQALLLKMESFDENIHQYVELMEAEARYTSIFQIAVDARERLRLRLSGVIGSQTGSEVENRIRQSVVDSFDYSQAESNLHFARRDARGMALEIMAQMEDIRLMCLMAKNPNMRERSEDSYHSMASEASYGMTATASRSKSKVQYVDVFTLFSKALRTHPRLLQIKDIVLELFKLYQHSYGMFRLDCTNLNTAIETMFGNSLAYFEAKEEDKDIRTKREKLKKIEGLIPFLEHSAVLMADLAMVNYGRFSRRISDTISEKRTPWGHIAEDLLRSKVHAEAELSTRL